MTADRMSQIEEQSFLLVQEVMNLGMMLEYLIKELEARDVVTIDIDKFNDYATERFEEIKQQAQKQVEKQSQQLELDFGE